jgi:hypothetical protein
MDTYYENSIRTLVFLGQEADESQLAMPFVNDIYSAITNPDSIDLRERKNPTWRAIQSLFVRPCGIVTGKSHSLSKIT